MEFSEAKRLLSPDPLPLEMGVERLPSGQLHVAVRTYLTGCSGEMFQWWFGSGPKAREYAWWHPVDHVGSEWLDLPADGSGIGATHVADEKLGDDEVHSLKIRFYDPVETFGGELAAARQRGDISAAVLGDIGMGADPPRDARGRPLGGKLVHLGRDTPFGMVLRSNFWLGWGLPLGPAELEQEIPTQLGLNLMKHSWQEWFYLARFLPAIAMADRRDEVRAPLAW
jgi:DAPG hydrolase PhiG domain